MHQGHQPAIAIFLDRVLVLHRKYFSPLSIPIDAKGDFGDLIAGFIEDVQHHLLGTGKALFELDVQRAPVIKTLQLPMIRPHAQPSLENAGGDFNGFTVLRLGGLSPHR